MPSTARLFWVLLIFLFHSAALLAAPKADIHLHYKWNQIEATTIEQALEILDQQDIQLAGVIGTPPELALELQKHAPDRIFSWYGVYKLPHDWHRWAHDPAVLEAATKAIHSGSYAGVGELHFIGGFIPAVDSPVIAGLLKLSADTQAPLLVHVEFSRANYLIELCQQEPKARLLLAHAGAPMRVGDVSRALESCPNLWWELSARDPMRYQNSLIAEEDGTLKPAWKKLILDFSDRLMLGSDPVWPVERLNAWDEDDTGWQHLGKFWDAHESWLQQLPKDIAAKIRLENALLFFSGIQND